MGDSPRSGKDVIQGAPNGRRSRDRLKHGRKVPLLLLGTLLTVTLLTADWFVIDGGALWEGMKRVFGSPETLREYILGFGGWAPVVFFLAQTVQVVVAPVPGGVTTVVGPLVFGPWVGTALILAGSMFGSVVLFASVRRWGRPLAVGLIGRKNVERFSGAFNDEKGTLLFFAMLVPLMPDDVVVAAAGLSSVSFRRFVVLVALGRLPGWAAMAFIAADLMGRSIGTLVTAGMVILIAAALVFLNRKRLESWLLRRTRGEREHRERASKEMLSSNGASRISWG